MLQIIHADAVRGGKMFQWVQFFEASPELVARFESAAAKTTTGDCWDELEPTT